MKKTIFALLLIAAIGLGAYFATLSIFSMDTVTREDSNVLLEKVKMVSKLVTVEGEFSDIYSHEDYYWQDISLFRKKALVKVKATVAVGYDLSKYEFEMRDPEKKIVIKRNTGPEILYIDTDISYYDLTEGTFNSFKPNELSEINKKAKAFIEKKALESNLKDAAEKQALQIEELILIIAEQAGYTVEFLPGNSATDLLN